MSYLRIQLLTTQAINIALCNDYEIMLNQQKIKISSSVPKEQYTK